MTVRPVSVGGSDSDAGPSPSLQVTTFLADDRHTLQPFQLSALRTVAGRVLTADERPLVGAIVEALPVSCDTPVLLADTNPDAATTLRAIGSTPACLPRPQQTVISDPRGYFSLPVDPGGYEIRVRPAVGTGFPWVTQPLVPSSLGTVQVVVPPPLPRELQDLRRERRAGRPGPREGLSRPRGLSGPRCVADVTVSRSRAWRDLDGRLGTVRPLLGAPPVDGDGSGMLPAGSAAQIR